MILGAPQDPKSAGNIPFMPDLPEAFKKQQQQTVDPFPTLGPGRECRVAFCVLESGNTLPQEMIDIISSPDKFVPTERKDEVIVANGKAVCAVTIWYVAGGLVPDTRKAQPPAEPEKEGDKPKPVDEDVFAPMPEIDLGELLQKGSIGIASFDRATPPATPHAEPLATVPAENNPVPPSPQAEADEAPRTALDDISSDL